MEPRRRVVLRAPPLRADVYHLRLAIDQLGYPSDHSSDSYAFSNPNRAWGSVRLLEDASRDEAEDAARAALDPMTNDGHMLWPHLKGPQFELSIDRDAFTITLTHPKSNREWLADTGLPNTDATWARMAELERGLRFVLRADTAHAREAIEALSRSRFASDFKPWSEPGAMLLRSTSVPLEHDWFAFARDVARSWAETWLSPRTWIGHALAPHMRGPHHYEVSFGAPDGQRDVCFITLTNLPSDDEWAQDREAREEHATWGRSLRGGRPAPWERP